LNTIYRTGLKHSRAHGIDVLDKSVLDLRVPRLRPSKEVFLEEPLRVRDAFFFRGV
jgi:hypothetical protein